jgi:hypothetical protein
MRHGSSPPLKAVPRMWRPFCHGGRRQAHALSYRSLIWKLVLRLCTQLFFLNYIPSRKCLVYISFSLYNVSRPVLSLGSRYVVTRRHIFSFAQFSPGDHHQAAVSIPLQKRGQPHLAVQHGTVFGTCSISQSMLGDGSECLPSRFGPSVIPTP